MFKNLLENRKLLNKLNDVPNQTLVVRI